MSSREVDGAHELVRTWVHRRPHACAVRDPGAPGGPRELSYEQLWARSGVLAARLRELGAGRGCVVALDLGRSADLVVAMVAAARAGAAYLPLDAHAPPARTTVVLREAGVAIAVGSAGLVPPDRPVQRVDVPTCDDADPGTRDADLPPAHGDDPVYVMFTSGSTGAPKGVVVPHRAVVRLVHEPTYCPIAPDERVAHSSNPAFDASTFEVWGALAAGACVVVLPTVTEVGMDEWHALLHAEGVTTAFLTTSLFHTVARERPGLFGGLRSLVVGGEQLDLGTVRRVLAAGPPRRLVNGYGPTETTTFAAWLDCVAADAAGSLARVERTPIGRPLQRTTLAILDDELRPVPRGGTGELCVGGPGVALGYLNRPDLTAERFVRPRGGPLVYRTGDLARTLPNGLVEVVGRADRQVKLRGFRIELDEVEHALTATGLVDAAFAAKVGDGPAAVLAAAVLPRAEPDPHAETGVWPDLTAEIARRLGERLPGYMVPARWVVVDALPLGPTGKADRAQLVALLSDPWDDQDADTASAVDPDPASGAAADTGADPAAVVVAEPARRDECATAESSAVDYGARGSAADAMVDELRGLCRELLHVQRVEADDGFIELGGNSITAVQFASRVHARFDAPIEPADVLLAESITELAGRVRALVGA